MTPRLRPKSAGGGRRLGAALALLLALAALGWWAQRGDMLRVRNPQGATVFSALVPPGGEFGIRFTHSVALSPVEEWFHAQDGLIALDRTVYQDFGAGLPHEPGPGQRMTFHDGYIEISGFTLRLPRLDVRVGRIARHALLLPERRGGADAVQVLPLSEWAPPGTALTFTLEKASLGDLLPGLTHIFR